jgi:ribose-phosphate pyrophosphokinase
VIVQVARRLGGDDFVLACTDAGRAKWVESLANDLGVDASFVFKRRLDAEHTEVAGISADVRGRAVIIYDDMIRTGGSLETAARAYRAAGAVQVAAIATHGLFPDGALEHLKQSGLFTRIICTDSHPRALALRDDFLQVESVAPLLAEQLKHVP